MDVLFVQAAMGGAFGPPASSSEGQEEEAVAAVVVAATAAAEQTPSFVFVKIAFGHLRRLLDALVALITETRAALPPSTPLPPSLPSSSSPTATLTAAIKAVQRLVSGVLALSRFFIDRYLCESKSSNPSTQAYLLTESHLLVLLHFIQSLRVPSWSLPSSLPPSSSSSSSFSEGGGAAAAAAAVVVPGWIEVKQQGTEKKEGQAASTASQSNQQQEQEQQGGGKEQSQSLLRRLSSSMVGGGRGGGVKEQEAKADVAEGEEEEEEENEGEVEDVLSLLLQPIDKNDNDTSTTTTTSSRSCGHVFLLANPILSCMGGTSSSVVRAAAVELLMEADLTGTFLEMRREIREQQVLLREADGEVVSLREEASRLSVSSVAGFF